MPSSCEMTNCLHRRGKWLSFVFIMFISNRLRSGLHAPREQRRSLLMWPGLRAVWWWVYFSPPPTPLRNINLRWPHGDALYSAHDWSGAFLHNIAITIPMVDLHTTRTYIGIKCSDVTVMSAGLTADSHYSTVAVDVLKWLRPPR